MKPIDVSSVAEGSDLLQQISQIQSRLFECEKRLDDLTRAAEISMITNQYHLLDSFILSAKEFLEDRLDLESQTTNDYRIQSEST